MMAGSKEKLVIVGDGETAELAYDYFTRDTGYKVVGFCAEAKFMHNEMLLGLPVVPFEEVEHVFDPITHYAFVAVSHTHLNRLRSRLYQATKKKGYRLCTYVSPSAVVAPDVDVGENCFILEGVVIQRGTKIGYNVTIWTGSSIGHRSRIRNNCFIATQVAVSGFCDIGENCFLGVNSCTAGNVGVADDCVVGAGAVVIRDAITSGVYVGNPARALPNKKTDVFIDGKETI